MSHVFRARVDQVGKSRAVPGVAAGLLKEPELRVRRASGGAHQPNTPNLRVQDSAMDVPLIKARPTRDSTYYFKTVTFLVSYHCTRLD